MPLSEAEKQGLRDLAASAEMREDMRRLAGSRREIFLRNGVVDTDRVLEFLCAYNEFINHAPKKFRPMHDKNMKL